MTGPATSFSLLRRLKALLRTLRLAAGLGWRIESNWTDPLIFAVYSVARPLSLAAILVVMYGIISRGRFDSPLFSYIYLGNAFYILVTSAVAGISWAVIDDRDRYRSLKFIYVAPLEIPVYLFGRGLARILTGSISVAVTLLFGVLFLQIPLNWSAANWPLFFLTLALGLIALAMMGLLMAGVTLLVAHHVEIIGEAVAGALYLVSGAVFPLDVLPAWLQPVGYAMPMTYWLELLRRSLIPSTSETSSLMSRFDSFELTALLVVLTAAVSALALLVFRAADHLARERGLIDKVSNY
jgi:ABC-2 type transport system permease protein